MHSPKTVPSHLVDLARAVLKQHAQAKEDIFMKLAGGPDQSSAALARRAMEEAHELHATMFAEAPPKPAAMSSATRTRSS